MSIDDRSTDRPTSQYGNVRFIRLKTIEIGLFFFRLAVFVFELEIQLSVLLFRLRCMTPSGNRDSPRTVRYPFNTQNKNHNNYSIYYYYYQAHQSVVVFSSFVTTNKRFFYVTRFQPQKKNTFHFRF